MRKASERARELLISYLCPSQMIVHSVTLPALINHENNVLFPYFKMRPHSRSFIYHHIYKSSYLEESNRVKLEARVVQAHISTTGSYIHAVQGVGSLYNRGGLACFKLTEKPKSETLIFSEICRNYQPFCVLTMQLHTSFVPKAFWKMSFSESKLNTRKFFGIENTLNVFAENECPRLVKLP